MHQIHAVKYRQENFENWEIIQTIVTAEGGQGNGQHESWNLNASTTSILKYEWWTLSYMAVQLINVEHVNSWASGKGMWGSNG